MIWAWLIAGILLTGMLLFVCSSIAVRLRVSRQAWNDEITIDVKGCYGLIRFRYSVPKLIWNENGLHVKTKTVNSNSKRTMNDQKVTITREKIEEYFHMAKELLAHTVQLTEWMRKVLARVVCKDLRWTTHIGLGDAADTAVTTGIVWGVKTSVVSYLFRHVRPETMPQLSVQPHFNSLKFVTEANVLFKIKTVYALYAGIVLIHRILKVKGGFRFWQKLLFRPS
ncbi:DUF2953 domain-containing protein [Paenibacillus ginsengarvi]|uniref:DUF2953 domain-containing protein n=1 Tax=Paenibacillus ginsengarvi TaxID=400777 RepID=A0A3B0CF91_9BACL|nr:DUF2953 domain-containing protein [Paenibacillus ginsengarvi]RKN84635.1 DUF2953 domain-containing protein [Paenibacillus ginsengarvi]